MLNIIGRLITFPFRHATRLLRGEKLFVNVRSREDWENDFKSGKWDQLLERHASSGNMAVIAHMLLFLSKPSFRRVLDVGCGNGALSRTLSALKHDFDYVALDISSEALEKLKVIFPSATTVCADMMDADAVPGDFDIIIFSECLYYANYEAVLTRYRHKLRPNGLVIVSMHGRGTRKVLWRNIGRQLREILSFTITDNRSRTCWNIKAMQYR